MTFEQWQQKFTIVKAQSSIQKAEGKSHQYIDTAAMEKANSVRHKSMADYIDAYRRAKR